MRTEIGGWLVSSNISKIEADKNWKIQIDLNSTLFYKSLWNSITSIPEYYSIFIQNLGLINQETQ